jgi:putative transposase
MLELTVAPLFVLRAQGRSLRRQVLLPEFSFRRSCPYCVTTQRLSRREGDGAILSRPAPADFLHGKLESGLSEDGQMKRSRFTQEQIIDVLREHDAGAKTADLARKHGVSEATLYNWTAKYGEMDVSEARRLKQLEEENAKLTKLLAEAMLDSSALREPGTLIAAG